MTEKKNRCCFFRSVLDLMDYNYNIKLYTDHTGNMHDMIDAQQIRAPIIYKYIRYSEASKMLWYQSIHTDHSPLINILNKISKAVKQLQPGVMTTSQVKSVAEK